MTAIPLNFWSEFDQSAIREQLDRVLKSDAFHQSQRRQRFLEYLVNETLAGRGERLKAYTIAVEVFERPDTFDPLVNPLVRIEAGRLRDKLREYYETDGRDDPVRIELPKGSYVPHIELRQAAILEPQVERRDAETLDRRIDPMQAPAAPMQDWSARNTTFQYKSKAVDVPKLGRELEVRYVLEGSVRRAGDGIRVTAQLPPRRSLDSITAFDGI